MWPNLKLLLFTISRSLPIETNIWKGHKNKGEVSKNEGGISKMCVSPRENNSIYWATKWWIKFLDFHFWNFISGILLKIILVGEGGQRSVTRYWIGRFLRKKRDNFYRDIICGWPLVIIFHQNYRQAKNDEHFHFSLLPRWFKLSLKTGLWKIVLWFCLQFDGCFVEICGWKKIWRKVFVKAFMNSRKI